MKQARLSLWSLLIVISLLAGGMATITSQSRLATSLAFTCYGLVVLLALSGAVVARGPVRAYCVGCFVFGAGYWLFAFETEPPISGGGPVLVSLGRNRLVYQRSQTRLAFAQSGDRFVTSELIDWLEESVRPPLAPGVAVTAQYNGGSYYTGKVQSFDGQNYIIIWDDGTAPSPVPPTGIRGHIHYIRTSAHSVFGLLLAVLGGSATRLLFFPFTESSRQVADLPTSTC